MSVPDHYYSPDPASASRPDWVMVSVLGRELRFATDAGVFSRDGLDPGSRLLIESAGELRGRVLDLGCGWGAVGVALALENPDTTFLLSDVNRRAAALAAANADANGARNARAIESDGFSAIDGTFDRILINPPIRAGKAVIYRLFADARERLNEGGALDVVIRKAQGAPSALVYLKELFGDARVVARGGGYRVIRAVRRGEGE
ncbi:MAG: class I SAM-dependent methyltransferase [Clostridiales bacterium]|nr:class I SAM-dependent methyltransferase [Clostridiales bacterium]